MLSLKLLACTLFGIDLSAGVTSAPVDRRAGATSAPVDLSAVVTSAPVDLSAGVTSAPVDLSAGVTSAPVDQADAQCECFWRVCGLTTFKIYHLLGACTRVLSPK